MKNRLLTTAKRNLVLLTGVLMLALSVNLTAQGDKVVKKEISENMLKNLEVAINSENEGLRRSAVYLAGKYKVAEVVDDLTEILSTEKDPNNRVLIALALNEIGSEEALKALKKLSVNDEDVYVRRMSLAIVNK
ncbi:MAG: HEAT repeat domain-containing protein [Ignavibacteriales bacterium]|nr:MAG: HEAT repeat domain-containing protein [Ignavibacteriales bacterium]